MRIAGMSVIINSHGGWRPQLGYQDAAELLDEADLLTCGWYRWKPEGVWG